VIADDIATSIIDINAPVRTVFADTVPARLVEPWLLIGVRCLPLRGSARAFSLRAASADTLG
jgi:hypothetical protein